MLDMNITPLETRRIRGDLIQMFKILKGLDRVNWKSEINWSESRAGRRQQMRREITNNNVRHNFFINRTANVWNNLPDTIVESRSVDEFKARVDCWLKTEAATAAS